MRTAAPLLFSAVAMITQPLQLRAEIMPHALSGDPHIQSVTYDPQNVVSLHVASGYATTIQFSSDERIETVTVGNSASWAVQVNHRADHLVVKPISFPSTTNLTVLTDQRTYNFTLYGGMSDGGVAPYMLSFTYPAPPVETANTLPPSASHYRLHGDRALWPASIRDDGKNTTIVWSADTTLPAVYRQDVNDQHALVNQVSSGGAYVIEGVYDHLIFIRGHAKARADRVVDRKHR